MDTGKEYIKMSEKAVEVQEFRKFDGLVHGDYYHRTDLFPQHIDIFCDPERRLKGEIIYGFIWLPRQDQLQEMVFAPVFGGHTIAVHWVRNIANYIESHGDIVYYIQFTSMEQLWLAFVMKKKYGKIWTGEDWARVL